MLKACTWVALHIVRRLVGAGRVTLPPSLLPGGIGWSPPFSSLYFSLSTENNKSFGQTSDNRTNVHFLYLGRSAYFQQISGTPLLPGSPPFIPSRLLLSLPLIPSHEDSVGIILPHHLRSWPNNPPNVNDSLIEITRYESGWTGDVIIFRFAVSFALILNLEPLRRGPQIR